MLRALWTGATGMEAQQRNIDVIANNLANINTTAFKKSQALFQDLLYQKIKSAGSAINEEVDNPTGIEVGHGVNNVSTRRVFTQGELLLTDQSLDVAIAGEGFFRLDMGGGRIGFTRDGAFTLNAEREIVTQNGYRLDPLIVIPDGATEVNVAKDGIITVRNLDGDQEQIGQMEIVNFPNPAGLSARGENIYQETIASGEEVAGVPGVEGRGELLSGKLEIANVKSVEEVVRLIEAQRAYEMNSKSIQTADEMLRAANDLKR
jgi:flagellar basal-body rod protein FlgG